MWLQEWSAPITHHSRLLGQVAEETALISQAPTFFLFAAMHCRGHPVWFEIVFLKCSAGRLTLGKTEYGAVLSQPRPTDPLGLL